MRNAAAFYRAIYERRDVRSHFLPDPVPDDVLGRILDAAHHALLGRLHAALGIFW